MNIPFTKMHGFGNDFMVLDQTASKIDLSAEKIRQLSNRHTGIGFDQVLQIEQASSSEVDFDYRIFNADGEEVEHCGNGARCFAKYVHDKGLSSKNPLRVKTVNRVLILHANKNGEVTVNMGMPEFELTLLSPSLPKPMVRAIRKKLVIFTQEILRYVAFLKLLNLFHYPWEILMP